MLPFLKQLLQDLEPILQPVYFISAWLFLVIFIWTIFTAVVDTIKRAKKMHKIPCTNCQYFTNNRYLKCTIQPNLANTEGAITCPDYCEKISY